MKKFSSFLSEQSHGIHYFDVDDTLMHTSGSDVKVHVKDSHGKTVHSLNSSEFNDHKLPPGHSYDFSEFKSAKKFAQGAKPIRSMLGKMKAIHKNGGNVEILTARADFDDKKKFADKWKSYGVDIGKIHVRRAGNITGVKPAAAKAKIISDAINQHGHKRVHLYDDSIDNINGMLALKKKHPNVEFHGHHVQHAADGSIRVKHYKA